MSLFSFSHVFELFAGISSALVGIKELQNYFADKFKSKLNVEKRIEDAEKLLEENTKIYNEIVRYKIAVVNSSSQNSINPNLFNGLEFVEDSTQDKRAKNNAVLHILKSEPIYAQKIASILSVFSFWFSLFLLVIAACEDAKFIPEDTALVLICHFELVCVLFLVLITIFYHFGPARVFILDCASGMVTNLFISILLLAALLTYFNPHWIIIPTHLLCVLIFLFIFLIWSIPFSALLCRYAFYLPPRLKKIEIEQEKQMEETAKVKNKIPSVALP